MPTSRTTTFVATALILYFFANQTQIGWLYVMSALMLGIIPACWLLNRRSLRGIRVERKVGNGISADVYEGDNLSVKVQAQTTGRTGVTHLRLVESCPLTSPDAPERRLGVFMPSIAPKEVVAFEYEITAYRRGWYEFPPLQMTSRAPLGLFQRQADVAVATRVLVYPEVRPLRRLALLDRQPAAQHTLPRSGIGSEVLGVRPFRGGDSPRHIHWRSVARTGRLISKEFADEMHPGLTLVLDRYRQPLPWADSKHSPFEWAIKITASIAEYAHRRGYPLHVVADDSELPPPVGAVSWEGLLQYLARIQPNSVATLPDLLMNPAQPFQNLIAVIVTHPDDALVTPLLALQRQGLGVLAVLLDPESFPLAGVSALSLAGQLRSVGIDTCRVRYGADWTIQLSEQAEYIR